MLDPKTDVSGTPGGKRKRRTGGHAARVKRPAGSGSAPAIITRRIPVYNLLDEESLHKLEAHADWILKEIGIEFRGDKEALELFKEAGATVTGVMLALFMANAGGAWDNAKKYIESGAYGGKGSDPHKAAVVGDTVGDPFKDTSGPSLNILIKLMSVVSLVLAPWFIG